MRSKYLGTSLLAILVAQAAMPAARAQDATKGPEEIVVTAQKRSEKLQKVPMSIQVLDSKKLDQLNVTEFADYVKFIPSLSFQKQSGSGPNQLTIYMRGVVDGGNANHSGPLPTVGTYLDELSTSTIGGNLDVHLYDVARVEALPGPQGTLYGASSESGTLRVITNKPNPGKFEAGYDLEGNTVTNGGLGFVAEGFVNIPITDKAAVRLVAFDQHDTGYIDNVYGTRDIPIPGAPNTIIDNKGRTKNGFNSVDTFGGRAALGVDLNDDWNVQTVILGQDQRSNGIFGFDPTVGDLKVQRFQPDDNHDKWIQAGLTVTGHLGDYELTYAGGGFIRDTRSHADYSDYTVAYADIGSYWSDNNGNPLTAPLQHIDGKDHYTKYSNEIRLASPSTDRLRFIVGAFQEEQTHRILQNYEITGLGTDSSVINYPGTVWLTNQGRTDRDVAGFGEVSYDVTDKLTLTGGVRVYNYDNSLIGYFGLRSFAFGGGTHPVCLPGKSYNDAPCVNLDATSTATGETHKINATYKIDGDKLVYFTYSTGYRPGGVNRRTGQGNYDADTLTNYELGFKSSWYDRRLTFNAAVYNEDWSQFQYSYLGANSLTIIKNAPSANIQGIEAAVEAYPIPPLHLSAGATLTDAGLSQAFCTDASGTVSTNCVPGDTNYAAKGTALPYNPPVKGYLTGRYSFPVGEWNGFVQGSLLFQSRSQVGIREVDKQALGSMPAYATADLSAGVERNRLSVQLFAKNITDERGQSNRYLSCTTGFCSRVYVVPVQPMTIGLKVSQKF